MNGATKPRHAMILAAGLGLRMRPLTETTPKPLLEVDGKPLIDHCLDHFAASGVETAVVNLHHLGEKIEAYLAGREKPAIAFSREDPLLDTGGGIRAALDLLGPEPFFIANADSLWLDGPTAMLDRLAAFWDGARMDALLLVHSTVEAYGYKGVGDFNVSPEGLLTRRPEREVVPYLYAGVAVLAPELFAGAPEGAFSLNALFDKAELAGRLYGIVHDGEWFHIGTPDGLDSAHAYMQERFPGNPRR